MQNKAFVDTQGNPLVVGNVYVDNVGDNCKIVDVGNTTIVFRYEDSDTYFVYDVETFKPWNKSFYILKDNQKETTDINQPKHSHYFKDISHLDKLDIYRLLDLYDVDHPCLQHAIKKLLVAGGRGAKDEVKDIQEAIDSLNRWMDMNKEDEKKGTE